MTLDHIFQSIVLLPPLVSSTLNTSYQPSFRQTLRARRFIMRRGKIDHRNLTPALANELRANDVNERYDDQIDITKTGWAVKTDRIPSKAHKNIRKAVELYRNRCLATFICDVDVMPRGRMVSRPKTPENASTCQCSNFHCRSQPFYFKTQYRRGVIRTVHFNADLEPLGVTHRGICHSLLRHLGHVMFYHIELHHKSSEEWYGAQQDWWSMNEKNFPILKLPSELRRRIYLACQEPVIEIGDPAHRTSPCACSECRAVYSSRGDCINLLLTNKFIFDECRDTYLRNGIWRLRSINSLAVLDRLPRGLDLPTDLSRLRHLELSFNAAAFMRYFGRPDRPYVNSHRNNDNNDNNGPGPKWKWWWWSFDESKNDDLKILKTLPLRKLLLHIPRPRDTHAWNLPWSGCLKRIADLYLTAAWIWVQGQPVVLKGYVTKQQKQDFEHMAHNACHKRAEWERLGLDWNESDEYPIYRDDDEEGGVPLRGMKNLIIDSDDEEGGSSPERLSLLPVGSHHSIRVVNDSSCLPGCRCNDSETWFEVPWE